MKAIVVEEIGSFCKKDIPMPRAGKREVVLKVLVTGLCRTDLKIVRDGHRDLLLPRVPGEEVVGEVVSIGEKVKGIRSGQRFYVYPGSSCGECESCKKGAGNLCATMQIMGFHRDGGFAEYVSAPAASLIPLPGNLENDEAVFAEPLSCCLNALELARMEKNESIGIWGGGPAGTLLKKAAKAIGAKPYVMEPDYRRRKLTGGFESPPVKGFDVAIVAVGSENAYREALLHLKPRGRLVVFSGLPRDNRELLLINFNRFHYNEQTLIGAYGCSFRHGVQALAMLSSGNITVKDMISHRMPLWELDEALRMVADRSGMKILLYP